MLDNLPPEFCTKEQWAKQVVRERVCHDPEDIIQAGVHLEVWAQVWQQHSNDTRSRVLFQIRVPVKARTLMPINKTALQLQRATKEGTSHVV